MTENKIESSKKASYTCLKNKFTCYKQIYYYYQFVCVCVFFMRIGGKKCYLFRNANAYASLNMLYIYVCAVVHAHEVKPHTFFMTF